jgi:hypothetical protein
MEVLQRQAYGFRNFNNYRLRVKVMNIRCERGSSIARRMGFPEPVANAIYYLDEHWDGGGYVSLELVGGWAAPIKCGEP